MTYGDVAAQSVTGYRSGYIGLIGLPNAGKSSLFNRLIGQTVSIVTPKPQTTRHRILGILNGDGFQAIFLDTPGLLQPSYKLQELMEKEAERVVEESDLLLLVVDATQTEFSPDQHEVIKKLASCAQPGQLMVALNKIDLVERQSLASKVEHLKNCFHTSQIYPVSALTGEGVEELKTALVGGLPSGMPFFPPDVVSEYPERFFVAEFIREAIFLRYGAEVPYSTTVVIDEFAERPGRKDYIKATIYVERPSQRAIIIGRDGTALKEVGSLARKNIERFLGRPVYLELWVKVAKDWRKNEVFIRRNVYSR